MTNEEAEKHLRIFELALTNKNEKEPCEELLNLSKALTLAIFALRARIRRDKIKEDNFRKRDECAGEEECSDYPCEQACVKTKCPEE